MNDIPQITELSIRHEKDSFQWDCFFKVKDNEHDFFISFWLHRKSLWLRSDISYKVEGGGEWYDSDLDWYNHITHQCVTAIMKIPKFRLKLLYLNTEISYAGDFTPSVYEEPVVVSLMK